MKAAKKILRNKVLKIYLIALLVLSITLPIIALDNREAHASIEETDAPQEEYRYYPIFDKDEDNNIEIHYDDYFIYYKSYRDENIEKYLLFQSKKISRNNSTGKDKENIIENHIENRENKDNIQNITEEYYPKLLTFFGLKN